MEKRFLAALEKLQLWQIMMVVSGLLLTLGFTGELNFTKSKIVKGEELLAIGLGCFFSLISILLRIFPLPPKPGEYEYNGVPSAAQIAFVSKFDEWESFSNASSDLLYEDHQLNDPGKDRKISQLRIELASHQGLLDRKVVMGVHYLRLNKKGRI